jgi:hypothetical protein
VEGASAVAGSSAAGRFVRLLDPEGRLAAVAETRGGILHPLVVLL